MKFLSSNRSVIFMTIFALTVFGAVFYFFDLRSEAFILALALVLFVLLILLGVSFVNYKKERNKEDEIERLQNEVRKLRTEQSEFYRDLESYFVLWIHQIKTPITAAKLMASNKKDKEMDAQLTEIENYTNLAMSYLKLKEPDRDLNFTNIQLDRLISPIIQKYSWSFIESKTKLIYQAIEDVVLTDANWTSIMIEQLINNALKYAAGKTIEIFYKNDSLFIKDTGVGIAADDLPKIFNKGYSGFYGTANQKSSGLGLFIVQNISRRLNQPVRVTSEPGNGTTFSIEFHPANLTKV